MKNYKNKSIWLYDAIYKQNILFLFGDFEDSVKYAKEQSRIILKTKSKVLFSGRTWEVDSYGIVIWCEKEPTKHGWEAVLAHEILHAALYTMNNKGIEINANNSEPITYYVEFLTRKVYELLRKKK